MSTRAEAVDAYLATIDGRALAELVRDDIVAQTGQLARILAGPSNVHPSLYGQRLADSMVMVAEFASLVTAATLVRVLHGAELAAEVR